MKSKSKSEAEEAKGRFEEWRNNRRGKARIPAELWSVAVEVARKEGINRTARELHVAWDDLKRHMVSTGEVPQPPGSPAFVELVGPQAQSVPECTLEVEGRRGKLRIQLKGAFPIAVVIALTENKSFARSKSKDRRRRQS